MDAFEQLVGQLLDADKFWVKHSIKIDLTPEEKKAIDKPTTPRPEIDIIALDHSGNIIYLLEVKSFLDSPGVAYNDVVKETQVQEGRYKILTSEKYRQVLSDRLRKDWIAQGFINSATVISFGLIAGNVHRNKEDDLKQFFEEKNWLFWGPKTIKEKLQLLSKKGYENNAVTIAAKLLLR